MKSKNGRSIISSLLFIGTVVLGVLNAVVFVATGSRVNLVVAILCALSIAGDSSRAYRTRKVKRDSRK